MDSLSSELQAWLPQAQQRVLRSGLHAGSSEIGRIESVADGIAHISGLPSAKLNELLRFENGDVGFVLTLEPGILSCVLLDTAERLCAGMHVQGTGDVLRVPVGTALLGRVVDPLGRVLDDGIEILAEALEPVEKAAPAIVDRDAVVNPVETGIFTIDTMFALGRGQRELIIGDRATGKTALGIDALINQKHSDMICVYVAIGQKSAAITRAIQAIREYGAPEKTIFVVAAASAPPGLQWIAPFAAFSIAEYFRDRGGHALVVIDDLSKHAATHRELALLTHQSPGREAYPGDVFYVHARLLERAAKLSQELGGGSLTALPIAETEAGNLSAYIPTNLISITDGQIVMDSHLFHAGEMPAIDTGLSVSRVGGKTQSPLLRQAVASLRLDYAQFVDLEMFTRFGTTLDVRAQSKIARGQRTRALLTQIQYAPQPLAIQLALLFALQRGVLDTLALDKLSSFKHALPAWLETEGKSLADAAQIGQVVSEQQISEWVASLHKLTAAIADEAV
jgi:F-type H+-transporting ATPase subunit alpha